MEKDKVRLFIAVDMPDEVVQEMARVQDIIKQEALTSPSDFKIYW